jgi:hypothetical protein
MNALRAYEVIDFIASTDPAKVIALHPSEATKQRASDLI